MQNFTGIRGVSALNSLMTKRAAAGLVLSLAMCFSISGQERTRADDLDAIFAFYRPELLTSVDSSDLVRELPMTKFLDGRLPGSTPLGRMGTAPVADFPMALVSAAPRQKTKSASAPAKDAKDSKDYSATETMSLQNNPLVFTGGEVGFMYGHSSGKFGGDEFLSYIVGGVGNDKMQINVGASYQEFNGHFSRPRP